MRQAGVLLIVLLALLAGCAQRGGARTTESPTPKPILWRDAGPEWRVLSRVAGEGNVRVAIEAAARRGEGGRWIVILADGPDRYCELDESVRPEDFPSLVETGFRAPPGPISRQMSILRSVVQPVVGYDPARGDRIIVLLCPRDQWAELDLLWP